jgi:hypothetical protein
MNLPPFVPRKEHPEGRSLLSFLINASFGVPPHSRHELCGYGCCTTLRTHMRYQTVINGFLYPWNHRSILLPFVCGFFRVMECGCRLAHSISLE